MLLSGFLRIVSIEEGLSQGCYNQTMEGKPEKIFPVFTLIFPCKQENIAFVKRITVLFLEKPKPLMGWTWSSLVQFPNNGMPEDHTSTPQRGRLQLSCNAHVREGSSLLPILLPGHRVSSQKTDTVRNLYSNISLPKTYSTPNSPRMTSL